MNKIMKKIIPLVMIITSIGFITAANLNNSSSIIYHSNAAASLSFDSNSIVSLVQSPKASASELTFNDIKQMVSEAVEIAGGLNGIIKTGDTVVLKPNLVLYHDVTRPGYTGPDLPPFVNGVCTDWRVVRAAAQLVREIIGPTGKIWVMEASSRETTAKHYQKLGYTSANIPEVDEFVSLENDSGSYVTTNPFAPHPNLKRIQLDEWLFKDSWPTGLAVKVYNGDGAYWVNRRMQEANAIINIPVLKNHWGTGTTGGVKNMAIGATPPNVYGNANMHGNVMDRIGRNNRIPHSPDPRIHNFIADYYTALPSHFTIMDGLQGTDIGPIAGRTFNPRGVTITRLSQAQKNARVILASRDTLALDIVGANLMNWDYASIGYLKYLTDAGKTGNGHPQNITVLGNKKVDDVRQDYRGIEPTGTRRLTTAEIAKPSLSIISAQFNDSNLNIKLNISPNTVKADIYIDGVFVKSENNNLADISMNVSAVPNGERRITVFTYTRYMAHAEAQITAVK
ncbi:MAG: DUF362 domain-containing protein [Treponema sp.]|nr:DUF362 domain-containing protein [Treponema sp.]